jgi:hypothetical protein
MVIKKSFICLCCLCLGFSFCKPKAKTPTYQSSHTKDSVPMQPLTGKTLTIPTPKDSCPIYLSFPKTFSLPRKGRLDLYEKIEGMDNVPQNVLTEKWHRYAGNNFDILVFDEIVDRFSHSHCIAISILNKKEKKVKRFCHLMTGTRGWRYLPNDEGFEGNGLDWAADLDKDGNPELLLWDSFYIDNDGILAVLFAWVYKTDAAGHFKLDKALTRQFAKRILTVYSKKIDKQDITQTVQTMAIYHLNRFINGACIY